MCGIDCYNKIKKKRVETVSKFKKNSYIGVFRYIICTYICVCMRVLRNCSRIKMQICFWKHWRNAKNYREPNRVLNDTDRFVRAVETVYVSGADNFLLGLTTVWVWLGDDRMLFTWVYLVFVMCKWDRDWVIRSTWEF